LWCCNPEGQKIYPEIKYTISECNGCGKCVPVCPENAIKLDIITGEPKAEIDRELCTNCGKCIDVCYTGALEFFGKYMTVEELFNIVKKDEQFFRASGGGVTIGGGEPTLQSAFTLAFLRKCRENYLHVAVDTCGYITTAEGFQVLEEADLILFDLKGMDCQTHMKNTGVSNESILENLKRIDSMGKPIIVRVPLIPGHTDSPQNIRATLDLLSGLKSLERVDLLAYHEYGKVKYGQLGKEYELNVSPLEQETLEEIKADFEDRGLNVQLGG